MMIKNTDINSVKLNNSKYDWKKCNDELPIIDDLVIVGWIDYINTLWSDTKTTIARYDGYRWIDYLDSNNTNLNPLYWTKIPDLYQEDK